MTDAICQNEEEPPQPQLPTPIFVDITSPPSLRLPNLGLVTTLTLEIPNVLATHSEMSFTISPDIS